VGRPLRSRLPAPKAARPDLSQPGPAQGRTAACAARLPEIAGALSLALARTFKIIDPDFKNPQSERWERSFRIFDLLL
jgi:Domain of unknown function (DUF1931)